MEMLSAEESSEVDQHNQSHSAQFHALLVKLGGDEPLALRLRSDAATGGRLWSSSVALASFLRQECSEQVQGVSLLELGAGAGLPGLVAARCGARVTLSDHCSAVLDQLRMNAALAFGCGASECNVQQNHTPPEILRLDWEQVASGEVGPMDLAGTTTTSPPFQYVVAADVTYWPPMFNALLATLLAFCGPGTRCYIAERKRLRALFEEDFLEDFTSRYFQVRELPFRLNSTESSQVTVEGDAMTADELEQAAQFVRIYELRRC